MKKDNSLDILAKTMSDDALWTAIHEQCQTIFITESGQRYHATIARSFQNGTETLSDRLVIVIVNEKNSDNTVHWIPRQEVLDSFHQAVAYTADCLENPDIKNDLQNQLTRRLGENAEFLIPIFSYLGVLKSETRTTTKRPNTENERCTCCGCRTEHLYKVSCFEDLCKLKKHFDNSRQQTACSGDLKSMQPDTERSEMPSDRKFQLNSREASANSAMVAAFNEEGEQKLCKICSITIYMALIEGKIPLTSKTYRYDDLDDNQLAGIIKKACKPARHNYRSITGDYFAEQFDNISMFFCPVFDKDGVRHCFALSFIKDLNDDGNTGLLFEAREIHRLTKNGTIAAGCTDTDYEIVHFRMCFSGEDVNHAILLGLTELIAKISDVLISFTLCQGYDSQVHYPTADMIDINGPGAELATMFSTYEGWHIKFYADDPNALPLRSDELLMQVRLNQKELVNETIELINMLTTNGKFACDRDAENFGRLFEKMILPKLKLYHKSKPRGYGKLAGMEIIRKLKLITGTEKIQEKIRTIIRR